MPRTIVVVPCYNEAHRLDLRALSDYARQEDGVEMLFVNDGSRDETLELLERLHQSHPRRYSFLHLARNGGKAEAVRQGMLAAMQWGADYVGFWDADLATPLSDIASFVRVLDTKRSIDVVVGTRIRLLGHRIERQTVRYWLGRVFARTASLALGLPIFDTQCGAKLFRVTSRFEPALQRPFVSRWIFDVEIFARLIMANRAARHVELSRGVYEFPLDAWRDVAGSTLKSFDFFKAAIELARIYWTYLRPGVNPAEVAGMLTAPAREQSSDRQRAA